jgi:hypothetical protein
LAQKNFEFTNKYGLCDPLITKELHSFDKLERNIIRENPSIFKRHIKTREKRVGKRISV